MQHFKTGEITINASEIEEKVRVQQKDTGSWISWGGDIHTGVTCSTYCVAD